MTGYDCLKEELIKRGCKPNQVESKVVPIVLDVLTQSGTKYTEIAKAEKSVNEIIADKQREINGLQWIINNKKEQIKDIQQNIDILNAEYEKMIKEAEDYITAFNESLTKCDSPEEQGVLKAAQLFINSVNINTKYDNTAYIIGLAQILSRGNFDGLTELKKLNPKLFETKADEVRERVEESHWRRIV